MVCFCFLDFKHMTKHIMTACKAKWISWSLRRNYIPPKLFPWPKEWWKSSILIELYIQILFFQHEHINILVTMLMNDEDSCSIITRYSFSQLKSMTEELLGIFFFFYVSFKTQFLLSEYYFLRIVIWTIYTNFQNVTE